ncbi:hypothetical protein [Streptomyces sp. NBC_00691]|uniref:hypothetical protein n=1 Tax=Streptomyces sp. NBC_00691 TaxID=2903671 RepID=UPI002E32C695|nr:hypothetical protein [Streptomyces sp. NBC_00691]
MGLRDMFKGGGSTPEPANPEMTEKGREYAIARRHGDRKTANRIMREVAEAAPEDLTSFAAGRDSYNEIPPAYKKPRRTRRRT